MNFYCRVQERKLFKGGNYSWKYGILLKLAIDFELKTPQLVGLF
jgi:hypothetical protein